MLRSNLRGRKGAVAVDEAAECGREALTDFSAWSFKVVVPKLLAPKALKIRLTNVNCDAQFCQKF